MKKVITLCLFAFVMILGSESVIAQSTPKPAEINAVALNKTKALKKQVQLNDDQCDQIYAALQAHEKRRATIKTSSTSKQTIEKLEKALDTKVKTILTNEQYERYLTYILEN